jgi:hypothetical protein
MNPIAHDESGNDQFALGGVHPKTLTAVAGAIGTFGRLTVEPPLHVVLGAGNAGLLVNSA